MEKLTLRAYAQKHKISFFNVMKMVKKRELKTVTVEENGKEVEYVLADQQNAETTQESDSPNSKKMSLEEENKMLKEEVKKLREALEKCNRRTVLATSQGS
jgi:predicted Zn-dependent protease